MRDLFYLVITCKDGRIVKLGADTSESCLMWYKLLTSVSSGASKREEIFAFAFHAWCIDEKRQMSLGLRLLDAYLPHNLDPSELRQDSAPLISEFKRLEFCDSVWRISDANSNFKLCDSYPRFMIVPGWITDTELERCAKYRFLNRMPAIVWRHRKKGSILLRSSQPNLGFFGWRCPEDEVYIQALLTASARQPGAPTAQANGHCVPEKPDSQNLLVEGKPMLILDARSYTAAWANRAKGGGFESPEYYQKCEIQFMGLANIHAIRSSFQQLRTLLNTEGVEQSTWLQTLQSAQWLQHLSSLFSAGVQVVEALHTYGRSVLVHCSDGWDRTTQIISLAKLILDPHYRTLRGFRDLVDREWVEFGHKFGDRCGVLNRNPNERSPVFLQWLDCVHQMYTQFPGAFEFNQAYLVKLAQHAYSGLFGTFLSNSASDSTTLRAHQRTFSIWAYLHPDNAQFRNVVYQPEERVLWPEFLLKDLRIWKEVYCMREPGGLPRPRSGSLQASGAMDRSLTRAHSCDSLTSIGQGGSEGTLVRRGSDSHLNNPPAAIQPPQYPASLCTQRPDPDAVQGRTEDVSLVLDGLLSRVSNPDSEDPVTPRAGGPVITGFQESLEPVSFVALPSRSSASSMEPQSNGVASDLNSDSNQQHPLDYSVLATVPSPDSSFFIESSTNGGMSSEFLSDISTSTTEISDPAVAKPRDRVWDTTLSLPHSSGGRNGYSRDSWGLSGGGEEARSGRKRYRRRRNIADWLDSDGLNTLVDVQQERMREMHSSYLRVYEKMESEMQRMRLMLRQQQNGYAIQRYTNGMAVPGFSETKKEQFEPKSVESASGLSDMSWENVDELEAQPTKWIPDHAVSHCMGCDAEFWAVNRKHHCRSCGKVFCSQCSKFEHPVPAEQLHHPVRVCNACYNRLRAEQAKTEEQLNITINGENGGEYSPGGLYGTEGGGPVQGV